MRLPLYLTLLLFVSTAHCAKAQDAAARLQKVEEKNALDESGKPPFHLRLSFQMYDLYGNTSDTGTVEEWWAAPGRSKTVITAASLKATGAVPLKDANTLDAREHYFVESLLQAEVHPVRPLTVNLVAPKVEEKDTVFSGVTLECFNSAPKDPQGTGRQFFSYCSEKVTGALRFQLERSVSSMARNQIGSFHDTQVALGLEIAYQDRIAIRGKVEALQSFDPAKSEVELSKPDTTIGPAGGALESGLILGRLISKVPPSYPGLAKSAHITGTVVLHVTISKQGIPSSIFALSSPHPALTASAIDAVKQWKYEPSTFNGEPSDINTVININFLMSPAGNGH